jgi:hypothetical protein
VAGLGLSSVASLKEVPPTRRDSPVGSSIIGSFTFGVLLAAYCLVGLLCTLTLRETRGSELIDPAPTPLDSTA